MSGVTKTWFGGTGNFNDPDNWSPAGVPGPGDLGIINQGTADLSFSDKRGVTIQLGYYEQTGQPVLNLDVAALGNVRLANGRGVPPEAPCYQTINVSHVGLFAGTVAPAFVFDDYLTIHVANGAALVNTGTITEAGAEAPGSSFDITGREAALVNAGLIQAEVGTITIEPAVLGHGTVELTPSGQFQVDTNVAFGGFVGPQQTVAFSGEAPAPATMTVQLDKPLEFLGRIEGFGGTDRIELMNTTAVSKTFANGLLALFGPDHALVAALRFAGNHTSADFTLHTAGGNTFIGAATAPSPSTSEILGAPHTS